MVWVKGIVRERQNKCCLYALSYMHLYFCTSWANFRHFPNTLISTKFHSFLNYFDSSDILILPTLFLMTILKITENVISCDKYITKITWSTLNLYIFSDIKESSRDWVMNLGDEYQNFLIFIALHIASVESWATNFW